MDPVIVVVAFAPLLLLIWLLVRYARRIQLDVVDSDARAELLGNLNPALVRFALERDRHTCRTCGGTTNVGVDFAGETPEDDAEITADDLEARCTQCYLTQWQTLRDQSTSTSHDQDQRERV